MAKTVFITGSSSGIGKETATLFQRNGWNVAATMRRPSLALDLDKLSHMAIPRLDVTDEKTILKAVKETIAEFGQIDVLVNNAGYGLIGPFEAATDEQIRKEFETNFFGLLNVTRAILPHFRARGTGTIVNIASVAGHLSSPLYSLYNASKWAVEGFSEALHYELRPFGIRVKVVEPGPVMTDFFGRSLDKAEPDDLPEYQDFVARAWKEYSEMAGKGVSPLRVANVIFKAATSTNWRLRYPTDFKVRNMLLLRRLLPDRVVNWAVRRVVLGKGDAGTR